MRSVMKIFIYSLLVLLLAACDPIARKTSTSTAIVGMKAIIKANGREVTSEIVNVDGKYVTVDYTDWDGNHLQTARLYRGLYTVSGILAKGQYEKDFPEAKLESLFPLGVGAETSFSGTFLNIDADITYEYWVHFHVAAMKTISLPNGDRKVFEIEITTEYKIDGKKHRETDVKYYDPEYNLVLKQKTYSKNSQNYWRVLSITLPGDGEVIPVRRRRSGSVLI